MRTLTLSVTAEVTLNGSGNGTAQAGPTSPGEIWYPAVVSVGTQETTVTSEAQCKIFAGPAPAQPNYVDGTLSGSTGDSTTNIAGRVLRAGQYVFGTWAGGDAGAVAFLNISGTRTVP